MWTWRGGLALCTSLVLVASLARAEAGEVYAFGDSLLDDGTIFRTTGSRADAASGALFSGTNFSNGSTAFDAFGRFTGLAADISDDLAIAGVFSGLNSSSIGNYPGTLAQVDAFAAAGGRFSARDVVLLDGGTNDLGALGNPAFGLPSGVTAPVTVGKLVTAIGANFGSILSTLRTAGLKDVFLYNVPNGSAAGEAINAELVTTAAAISGHGLNVHVFDLFGLLMQVAKDPARYGFLSGGACAASAACVADPASLENRYFTVDGLHPTATGHELIARYLASQYVAPQAVLPEATIAESTAIMFSQTLIARLDSAAQSPGVRGPGAPAAIAPYLPDVLVPSALGPVTGFISASLAGGRFAAHRTTSGAAASGYGTDFAGLTMGSEIQPATGLRLGSAFSYLDTDTGPTVAGNRIALQAFQGGFYGSLAGPNAFVDEVITAGFDVYSTARAGVVTRVSGAPIGATVSTETKAGYLSDWGPVRIGPIGDLAYTHVLIGPYSESGDPLLALKVGRQSVDALTVAAGLELRSGALVAPWMTAVLDVTADHDCFGGRMLTTALTDVPTVPIRTTTAGPTDDLYGRIRGAIHADLAGGLSGELSGFTTVARGEGDVYGVDARLTYRY